MTFTVSGANCASVKIHPSGLAYAALNVGLDRLDNYAERGHFPRINRPLLDLPGFTIGSAGRTMSKPDGPRSEDSSRTRSPRPRFSVRADPHQVYFELSFRF